MKLLGLGTAVTTLALLAVPSVPAEAGSCEADAVAIVEHIFVSADSNQDDILTPAEYDGAGLERFGVTFAESDADGDGLLTLAEYVELYERHHPSGDQGDA